MLSATTWRYVETFFRYGRWFGALLVLVPVLTAVVAYLGSHSYEAVARVWIDSDAIYQPLSDPYRPKTVAEERQTQLQQLLTTKQFREDVAARVERSINTAFSSAAERKTFVDQLPRRLAVETTGPYVLEIRYRSTDAQQGPATISAALKTFQQDLLAIKRSSATQAVTLHDTQLAQITEQLAAVQRQMTRFQETTLSPRTPDQLRELDGLQQEAAALEGQRAALVARRPEAVDAATRALLTVPTTFFVVDPPRLPEAPSTNWLTVAGATILAFVFALAITAGATVGLTQLDDTIREEQDVRRRTGVRVLGRIPAFAWPESDGVRPQRTAIS